MTQRQLNLYYYFLFIREHLMSINAKDVIELGCGRGTISLFLADHLGLNLTLVDNNEDAINIAKGAFAEHNTPARFVVDDARNTGFPSESFDLTVSIGLAEHMDDVDKLFAEQYRLLKPGGQMISLNIPRKFSAQSLNAIHKLFKKLFAGYKDSVRKDYYRNSLNPNQYKELATQIGFNDVTLTHVCPFPIYVPVTIKTDRRIARMRKTILKIRNWFQAYPYKTNPILAQGHFLVARKPDNHQ